MKAVKNYYRLMEIEKEFGLSHFDYLYLCEKFKNPIYYYAHHQLFLIGTDLNWSGELHGAAYYKGLIRLERNDRIRLIRNGSVIIKQCYLDSKKGILSYLPICNAVSPEAIPKCWSFENVEESELDEASIRSYVVPSTQLGHTMGNIDLERIINFTHTHKNDTNGLKLNIDDMVLTPDDVYWAKAILNDNEEERNNTSKSTNDKERENILHLTVSKLIKAYPSKGGARLWSLIYEGFLNENDDIDPFSIFIEVSKSEIVWLDGNETEQTMQKSTFQNLVSKLKNKN